MSLKVVIVEDNPLTVQSLLETIDWASLDCQIVGTAYDGKAGQKLILEEKPDILLTDIRMPQSNGLDMLEAVRDEVPNCKAIIITGYEEFQYASKAIKLSVFDYLLKPVDNEEVTRSVARAVSMTRRNNERTSALVRAQLLTLLTNPAQRGQGIAAIFEEMHIHFQAYYVLTLQKQDGRSFMQADLNHLDALFSSLCRSITFLLHDMVVVFVMLDEGLENWKQDCNGILGRIQESSAEPLRMGVSELNHSLHAINEAYSQARQALWKSVLEQRKHSPAEYDSVERDHMRLEGSDDVSQMNALIERSDLSDDFAREAADTLWKMSGEDASRLRALTGLYAIAMRNRCSLPFEPKLDAVLDEVWIASNRADTIRSLTNLSRALRELQQPSYSLLTRNALQYISLHAAEGLQLSDVAEKLCVSSTYLSSLVSKETGVTFHEHVTAAKMTVARTMLSDPRMLVEEIAYAVGYNNYISFYNAFKRTQHMTPTEYRNKVATT